LLGRRGKVGLLDTLSGKSDVSEADRRRNCGFDLPGCDATRLDFRRELRQQAGKRCYAAPFLISEQENSVDIGKISIGRNPPTDINVIIEIPQGGEPVKYELDKESGAMFVDRFLHTAMFYPGNYGFVPHTLADDGDPVDVLVVGNTPIVPGAVVRCRPLGALLMEDEGGPDEKIIAVPVDKLHPFYENVRTYEDLPAILRDQIAHFFQHYKDLEKGKWVTIAKWVGPEAAGEKIMAGAEAAKKKSKKKKSK
jgi:inorganic pyrophosphatase